MKESPVVSYPDNAILDIHELAAWLKVSTRTVERLDIPGKVFLGYRTKRWVARDVLAYLEKRKSAA